MKTVIVSGFPRTGSSLMMQMLNAAGVRCYGEHPSYEDHRANIGGDIASLISDFRGGAIKILDPTYHKWPSDPECVFIWMRRNRFEQAKSNVKFMKAMGIHMPKGAIAQLQKSFVNDEPRALKLIRATGGEIVFCTFEQAIRGEITAVSDALGINPDKMRSVIVPRGPECLRGLLELRQIA